MCDVDVVAVDQSGVDAAAHAREDEGTYERAGALLLLSADLRIGVEGAFQIGLNEVKIGLTVPGFVIELARQRLHPAAFDRSVVNAVMCGPDQAVAAGFLDRVVPRCIRETIAARPPKRGKSWVRD